MVRTYFANSYSKPFDCTPLNTGTLEILNLPEIMLV